LQWTTIDSVQPSLAAAQYARNLAIVGGTRGREDAGVAPNKIKGTIGRARCAAGGKGRRRLTLPAQAPAAAAVAVRGNASSRPHRFVWQNGGFAILDRLFSIGDFIGSVTITT